MTINDYIKVDFANKNVGIGEEFKFPEANTDIWIANNVCIRCNANYRWWNRLFVKIFFGWKVKNKEEK